MKRNAFALALFAAAGAAALMSCSLFEGLKGKQASQAWDSVFRHKVHVASDMACTDCHPGVDKEAAPGLPAYDTDKNGGCAGCHDISDKDDAAYKAMNELKARTEAGKPLWRAQARAATDVKFNHAKHVKGVTYKLASGQSLKLSCADCHGDIAASTTLPKRTMPTMELCTDCHAKGKTDVAEKEKPVPGAVMNDCAFCHAVYRKDAAPADHRGLWPHTHGEEISFGLEEAEKRRCAYCHADDFCLDCHSREKPRSHTNYFRMRGHGIDASLSRERCSSCHLQDFCVRCHDNTRPQSHVGSSWATEPYRHCTSCHQPVSMTSCAVCHKIDDHLKAPPYPRDSNHTTNCTMSCHTRQHPDPGPICQNCHK